MKKYTCPMHPQILKDEPGKCPLCGMNLIPLGGTARPEKDEHSHHHQNHDHHSESDSSAAGFDKHAGHHTPDFLKRFWITLVLSVPVLLLSHMIQQWLGFHFAQKPFEKRHSTVEINNTS
jgi:Cu2+-exporting ATPase